MELKDANNRKISYLRLSVTDRCNFRCVYCMPSCGLPLVPRNEILDYEVLANLIEKFVRIFGVNKVRLTGGEPMVRLDIEHLVKLLGEIDGITDLCMTTNGTGIKDKAKILKDSGLDRVNISIDTLNPYKFRSITNGNDLDVPLSAVDAAHVAGLSPVKINTVLLPGFNEERELIEFGMKTNSRMRFIELMPGEIVNAQVNSGMPPKESDILERLSDFYSIEKVIPTDPEPGIHVDRFLIKEHDYLFEFVPCVSSPFCSNCNRIRIDCRGFMRPCLYSDMAYDLKDVIDASDEVFASRLLSIVQQKGERPLQYLGSAMSSVGG